MIILPKRKITIAKPTQWNSKQVAEYLDVSQQAIGNWCREGRMPHTRIGRLLVFDPDEIKRWEANGGMAND